METILGLAMIYAWVHSVVIGFKKLQGLTQYEKVVLWVGFISMILYVIGTMNL
jgi:hypothetical protein